MPQLMSLVRYHARLLTRGTVLVALVIAARLNAVEFEGWVTFHVDPTIGADDASRDGSAEKPFRSLTYAVARGAADEKFAAFLLAPGTYSGGAFGDGSETFPIVVPEDMLGFRLGVSSEVVAERGERPILVAQDPYRPLLSWRSAQGISETRFELDGVSFEGGREALSIVVPAEQHLEMRVVDCAFSDSVKQSLAVVVRFGSRLDLNLSDSQFLGAATALGVDTEALAIGNITVSDSEFLGASDPGALPSTSLGEVFGAALDAHVGSGSTVEVNVDRNVFRNVGTAVILTTDEPSPSLADGRLGAKITNNVIDGWSDEGPYGILHALYLSLWPNHELDVSVVNNTIVGVEGHVVFQDNLAEMPRVAPWTFANNLCFAVRGASEFALEGEDASFPPDGVVIEHNGLARSALGRDDVGGNFRVVDPGFVDLQQHDFHLGESAVGLDRGSNSFTADLHTDHDATCRRAAAVCPGAFAVDVGAFEREGTCEQLGEFKRGDCDADLALTLSDPITLLNFLFLASRRPVCLDACDADDSGSLVISDAINTLTFLFLGGVAPAAPYPAPGLDPTCDPLGGCPVPSF